MICRPHRSGWLLITQPAHAWMAGELAAAWGNEQFAPPTPYEAVVMATRLHDIGWLAWDTQPRLDRNGLPVNFIGTTLEETIPVWRQAVRWAAAMDPFAAILISMHATTIYRRRLERGADPPERQQQVQDAVDEHDRLQASLREALENHPQYGEACQPQHLARTYRWLRICDLLSLAILSGTLPPEGQIDGVPELGDTPAGTLHYQVHPAYTLEVSPWPFKQAEIKVPVAARYLRQETFAEQPAYHRALAEAEWSTILAVLRPPG